MDDATADDAVPEGPSRGDPAAVVSCPVCGLGFSPAIADGCPNRWCRRSDRAFSVVYSIGTHGGSLRHELLRYKYHGEWSLARGFALIVGRFLDANATSFEEFDCMTGVPSFTGPGARRGWDPVGRILEELRRLVGDEWVIEPGLVSKVAETRPMQGLSWGSRRAVARELRAALTVNRKETLHGARVLAFDDVLAEGSTLREVARALRLAGAEEVAGLVLARPFWSARRGTSAGRAGS